MATASHGSDARSRKSCLVHVPKVRLDAEHCGLNWSEVRGRSVRVDMTLQAIIDSQTHWAQTAGLGVVRGCVSSIDDNLFRSMHPDTWKEFSTGSGDELGLNQQTKRAKMLSLRSSSILAVNVLDYWRERDLAPLASALQVQGDYTALKFEQKFPHGLASTPPNLDAVLSQRQRLQPLAIECKFAEPYDTSRAEVKVLNGKYFAGGRKRWTEVGLPRCQRLADGLKVTSMYRRLDSAQLLKHLLGLAHSFAAEKRRGPIRLLYLWYDTQNSVAREHADEVVDFGSRLDQAVEFRICSYQSLFRRLMPFADHDYLAYLGARYFHDFKSA